MTIDDHGAEQQGPDGPVIQPERQKWWPDPQEAEGFVLTKAINRHEGSAYMKLKNQRCCSTEVGHFNLAHVKPGTHGSCSDIVWSSTTSLAGYAGAVNVWASTINEGCFDKASSALQEHDVFTRLHICTLRNTWMQHFLPDMFTI